MNFAIRTSKMTEIFSDLFINVYRQPFKQCKQLNTPNSMLVNLTGELLHKSLPQHQQTHTTTIKKKRERGKSSLM